MAEANGDGSKALDSLLNSLTASADRLNTAWLWFLGFTLGLWTIALATDHRALLLAQPIGFPLPNVNLVPLLVFYVAAPLIYLVAHFYIIVMFLPLVSTASTFERQLKQLYPINEDAERFRACAQNSPFLQLLVGARAARVGTDAFLIMWITVALAPMLTLILMQMKFLPYHSFWITWWHRSVVGADLMLVILALRQLLRQREIRSASPLFSVQFRWQTGLYSVGILGMVVFVVFMSFWEGRWAGETLASYPIGPRLTLNDSGRVVFGLFPIRLELENEPIVGAARYKEVFEQNESPEGGFEGGTIHTLLLDSRDLQFAKLFGSDLREVSLRDADMRGATMTAVRLDDADLTGAKMSGVDLRGAILRDFAWAHADFAGAHLEGANLRDAILGGAYLANASLQGADLTGANMSPSDLHGAHLQGADLTNANLQGANLRGAELQGAILTGAKLADADLTGAYVFGAQVSDIEMDGAPPIIGDIHADAVRFGDVVKWRLAAVQFAPYGKPREHIELRFEALARATFDQVDKEREKWAGLRNRHRSDSAAHRQQMAQLLGDLVCSAMGAPFAGHVLVAYPPKEYNDSNSPGYRLAQLGEQLSVVSDRIRACRGSVRPEDWPALDAIKPAQEPASSNAPVSSAQ